VPFTFDPSLEKLESHKGINPYPDDFDDFRDKALAEAPVRSYANRLRTKGLREISQCAGIVMDASGVDVDRIFEFMGGL